jgi:S-adenosylmethionine decarboxylase
MSVVIPDHTYLAMLGEPSVDVWDGVFGVELQLDLGGCDPAKLDDEAGVRAWCAALVDLIGMEAYGEPVVQRFGKDTLHGLTLVQLITTSNINFHGAAATRSAHINVFSCRPFDPTAATEHSVTWFAAARHLARVAVRRTLQEV